MERQKIPVIDNDWDTYDEKYDALEKKYWVAHDKINEHKEQTVKLIQSYKSQKIERGRKDAMEILKTK